MIAWGRLLSLKASSTDISTRGNNGISDNAHGQFMPPYSAWIGQFSDDQCGAAVPRLIGSYANGSPTFMSPMDRYFGREPSAIFAGKPDGGLGAGRIRSVDRNPTLSSRAGGIISWRNYVDTDPMNWSADLSARDADRTHECSSPRGRGSSTLDRGLCRICSMGAAWIMECDPGRAYAVSTSDLPVNTMTTRGDR